MTLPIKLTKIFLILALLTLTSGIAAAQIAGEPAQKPVQKVDYEALKDAHEAFYKLTGSVTAEYQKGQKEAARASAEKLLKDAESFKDNWNYGNAVHVANLVLGHLALDAGDLAAAKSFLLAAGKSPGSPQLNSFGPNMSLAKRLLEKGEQVTVFEYFDLCDKFWSGRFSKTAQWRDEAESGQMPKFGASLKYGFETVTDN